MDVPAGWYPDPAAPASSARWWDGTGWTEHTTTLESLGAAPAPPGPPEPVAVDAGAPTVVVPAAEAGTATVVTPLPSVGDTAVYPAPPFADTAVLTPGPAYTAAPPYPGTYAAPPGATGYAGPARRSSTGWVVGALVAVLVLVVAGAGFLLLHSRSTDAGSAPPASGPTTNPPVGAAQAASVLETFKPSSLPQGVEATLVAQGDVAQGQKTLDGWCSDSYASEPDRIARRQWSLTQGGQDTGLSVETVAYRTDDAAARAFAEFVAATQACHNATVSDAGTQLVQNLVSSQALTGLPSGVSGQRAVITVAGTSSSGAAFTLTSTATVQRKGQYMTIVWTNSTGPVTSADQQVIDRFAAAQAAALAATSS